LALIETNASYIRFVCVTTRGAVVKIIVSGSIRVDEAERDRYLAGSHEVIAAARSTEGCIDFHLSADPIEPDRINVYEQWESVAAVEAFRGSGPSDEQSASIRGASMWQHEVASSTQL
jgi:quinol monooxygenase YgiN